MQWSLIYVSKRRRNLKMHPIFSSFTWDQSKQWPNSDDNNTLEKDDHWWKVTLGAIMVRQIIVKSVIKSKQMFAFAIWETFDYISDNKSQIWFTRYLVSNWLIFLRNKRCAIVIIKPFVKSLTYGIS
jgi:nicotinamide riboside transporter PnuC